MSEAWNASGTLTAAGCALEYACFGPSPHDAPSIVLLHEGLGSAALWRDFPSLLCEATGLGVMAYSRAGYGQSDLAELPRPLDYMTREAETVLPEVLNAIGFSKGVLVGHSDGATIAAIHTGSIQDERVQGIVLMAPHFFTESVGLAAIADAKQAFDSGDLRERMAKYHRDPENTFRGWNDSWLHPDFKAWNVAAYLDSIRVPVLAVQGREDQYGSLKQIDEIVSRCPARVEQLILDDCRHSPFLDCPDTVVSSVATFCASLA